MSGNRTLVSGSRTASLSGTRTLGRGGAGAGLVALALALAALVWPATATAQPRADPTSAGEPGEPLTTLPVPRPGDELVDPSGDSDVGTPSSSGTADGTLVLGVVDDLQFATAGLGQTHDHWTWSVAVTGVIDTGVSLSVVPNLDALVGFSRVEAGVSYLHWSPRADVAAQTEVCAEFEVEEYVCDPDHPSTQLVRERMIAAREEVCREHHSCKLASPEGDGDGAGEAGEAGAAGEKPADACANAPCREGLLTPRGREELAARYGEICEGDKRDIRANPKYRLVSCSRGRIARRVRALAGEANRDPSKRDRLERYRDLLARFDRAVHYGKAWLVGVRVKAARETLAFADPATFEAREDTFNMGSATLSLAAVLERLGTVIASYEFQHVVAQAPPVELCGPTPIAGTIQCRDLSIGEPEQVRAHIARLELRRFFSDKFAIAARASYEFTDQVFGAELPLFFMRNRKGGFAGGVSVGFRSDTDEPLYSVFVSGTLSLLPR